MWRDMHSLYIRTDFGSNFVKSSKRRTIEICQIIKTKHVINFSWRNSELEIGSKSVKSSKQMHIRPHDNRLFRMDLVKFHCGPRTMKHRIRS